MIHIVDLRSRQEKMTNEIPVVSKSDELRLALFSLEVILRLKGKEVKGPLISSTTPTKKGDFYASAEADYCWV